MARRKAIPSVHERKPSDIWQLSRNVLETREEIFKIYDEQCEKDWDVIGDFVSAVNERFKEIDEVYEKKIKQVKRKRNIDKKHISQFVDALKQAQDDHKRSLITALFNRASNLNDLLEATNAHENSRKAINDNGFKDINLNEKALGPFRKIRL